MISDNMITMAFILCGISITCFTYGIGKSHGMNECNELLDEQTKFIDYILNGGEQ